MSLLTVKTLLSISTSQSCICHRLPTVYCLLIRLMKMVLKSYFLVETLAKLISSLLMDTRYFCVKDAKRGISMCMQKILRPQMSLVELLNHLSPMLSSQVRQKNYTLFLLTLIARFSKHMSEQDIVVLASCAKWQKRVNSLVSNHTTYVTCFVPRVLQAKLC